jgi:hypothetical protein
MSLANWLGTIGVSILLLAYVLDLLNVTVDDGLPHLSMNFIGASLACASAYLIWFKPFIVLEGIWAAVSLVAALRILLRSKN